MFMAHWAVAEVEFTGIFATEKKTLLGLSESSTGRSAWVEVGKGFEGYVLTSFDSDQEVVTLTKGPETLRVHLKYGKVKEGRFDVVGTIQIGEGAATVVTNATMAYDVESVFPLAEDVVLRITPTRRADGTILYSSKFERSGTDGKKETLSAPKTIARPDQPFGIKVDKYGYSFKPKGA